MISFMFQAINFFCLLDWRKGGLEETILPPSGNEYSFYIHRQGTILMVTLNHTENSALEMKCAFTLLQNYHWRLYSESNTSHSGLNFTETK